MARQGVWQLKRLTVNYCNFSGSSRGARYAIEHIDGTHDVNCILLLHRGVLVMVCILSAGHFWKSCCPLSDKTIPNFKS